MLYVAQTALELGFQYALVAMALFLSYRVLDIADLTTDGCFVLGCAVSVTLTAAGHPFLAIPAAMLAGACAGFVTAFLQTKLGVPSILAGIITNIGLYSVNLMVMGKSNQSLFQTDTIYTLAKGAGFAGSWYKLAVTALIVLALAAALVLGLAACGKDTTGDDWRASGVVTDYGTITRDGERVPVCICLSTENAGFYYDKDEQVWFDGVEFPMTFEDAETAYSSTSFDDLDGDGQSDVTMIFDHGDGSTTELVWLWYDDTGFEFEPVLSSVTSGTPYFEANNLDINARVDGGTYVLANGVCSYHGTGDGYAVGDVYWEVTKTRDETHDGMREIEFDAYCYVPDESVPAFTTEFISVTSSELYDYYTGMWFTASTAYNNTERGDNHYIHTVSWNGETYEIEFFYSTSWEKTGDWNNVLTKSYVVYLPEGYDGLVFAAEPQPDNFRDSGKRDQLDSICPEADILNCTTVDAHNCLFFRIG